MSRSEASEVLRATARMIEEARAVVPRYATGFASVGSHEISKLLKAHRTHLVNRRFASDAKGMAMPFVGGGQLIALDTACTKADAAFTVRHELAHVLGGESSEPTYLTAEDTLSFSERRADLFAIADLTPARWLEWVRGRRPWKFAVLDVKEAYRNLTCGWSELRLDDRAQLRVQLYRRGGI